MFVHFGKQKYLFLYSAFLVRWRHYMSKQTFFEKVLAIT